MTTVGRAATAALAAAAFVLALGAGAAHAHPLGNFSVNRLDVVRVEPGRVVVERIVDQAEVPTFQDRALSRAQRLARAARAARAGLALTVDGRRVALRAAGPGRIALRPGAGGLPTARLELRFEAAASRPRSVVLRDRSYAGRVGWKAIVARPAAGTAVRADTPAGDPTRGLRSYPRDLLSSPPDQVAMRLAVRPGAGTVSAPRAGGGRLLLTLAGGSGGRPAPAARPRGEDGLAGLLERAAAGRGVLVVLLLAAAGWGALHALSPGHGKGMVAAYLVGTSGTARQAVLLGATVTVTHTIGVFGLGLVTLALSAYVLPEQLYPWLTLASGAMVVAVGLAVLRRNLRASRHGRGAAHGHHHHHGHGHGHHHPPARAGTRGVVAMGASAGLLPCPSALVVLLAAIAQHELALGLLLIVAFSAGLAATLTALGLAVVCARGRLARIRPAGRWGRAVRALPSVSAVAIVAAGLLLAAQALPSLS